MSALNPLGSGVFKTFHVRENGVLKMVYRFGKDNWYMTVPTNSNLLKCNPVGIKKLEGMYKELMRAKSQANVVKFPKEVEVLER